MHGEAREGVNRKGHERLVGWRIVGEERSNRKAGRGEMVVLIGRNMSEQRDSARSARGLGRLWCRRPLKVFQEAVKSSISRRLGGPSWPKLGAKLSHIALGVQWGEDPCVF